MSDTKVEFKFKESLTRQQAADKLSALASALAKGSDIELELGGATVSLGIPDEVRSEVEVEVEGDEVELELELKWSTAHAEATASSAEAAQERPQPRAIPSL